MKEKQREPRFQSGGLEDDKEKGYFGMDPEMSLLSVNFATTENAYLNAHYQEEPKENEEQL